MEKVRSWGPDRPTLREIRRSGIAPRHRSGRPSLTAGRRSIEGPSIQTAMRRAARTMGTFVRHTRTRGRFSTAHRTTSRSCRSSRIARRWVGRSSSPSRETSCTASRGRGRRPSMKVRRNSQTSSAAAAAPGIRGNQTRKADPTPQSCSGSPSLSRATRCVHRRNHHRGSDRGVGGCQSGAPDVATRAPCGSEIAWFDPGIGRRRVAARGARSRCTRGRWARAGEKRDASSRAGFDLHWKTSRVA